MSFKDEINRAAQGKSDFDPPDGHHRVKIVDGGAFAGGDGRRWVKVTLEITDGPHAGERFDDFNGWDQEVGQRVIYSNLSVYGVGWSDIEEFEDLETAILELTGVEAVVTTKHSSGGFLNVTAATAKSREPELPGQEAFDTNGGSPSRAEKLDGNDRELRKPAAAGYGQARDDDDLPF